MCSSNISLMAAYLTIFEHITDEAAMRKISDKYILVVMYSFTYIMRLLVILSFINVTTNLTQNFRHLHTTTCIYDNTMCYIPNNTAEKMCGNDIHKTQILNLKLMVGSYGHDSTSEQCSRQS